MILGLLYKTGTHQVNESPKTNKSYTSGFYPIRTVSELTGINTITLRAWESRYGLIEPVRKNSGHGNDCRRALFCLLPAKQAGYTLSSPCAQHVRSEAADRMSSRRTPRGGFAVIRTGSQRSRLSHRHSGRKHAPGGNVRRFSELPKHWISVTAPVSAADLGSPALWHK